MKHIKNESENVNSEKLSIKKMGTIIGSGAVCVALAGVISVSGLFEKNSEAVKKDETSSKNVTVENVNAETEDHKIPAATYTTLDTVIWRKASINEYEIAQTQKTQKAKSAVKAAEKTTSAQTTAEETKKSKETEQTSKKAETTAQSKETKAPETTKATKKTTAKTTTAAKTKSDTYKTMYIREDVNFRQEPSWSANILTIIDGGKKVQAGARNSEGWYSVKYNGMNGYVREEYLVENAPAAETQTQVQTQSQPNTIQNTSTINYTTEEFNMLCYVLQGEVGHCSDASKLAVANVIINRVKSPSFPNTISGVLTSGNQFTAISGYYNKTTVPTESTISCAQRALNGEDNSNGAIYYYAPKYCGGSTAAWFETLTFCMELEGQRFFK